MANDARRKERQRLKRKQKRHVMRRIEGSSPYHRFGSQGDIVACYVNQGWQEDGLAEVLVLKRVGLGMAYAAFLVDMWCTGLKDAWGRINITRSDFDKLVERAGERLEIVRIDPSAAWRIVSGGVRFCHQNGFRLPPRYERWTALLGSNADCASADLSDFGIDGGKLRYVGTMEDLRKRLVSCRPEEFLNRKDVEFILGDQPWETEDDALIENLGEYENGEELTGGDGDSESTKDETEAMDSNGLAELEEAVAQFQQGALDAVRKWCFANGIKPHPRLPEAVGLMIESMLQTPAASDDLIDEASMGKVTEQLSDSLDALLSFDRPEEKQRIQEALDQMTGFGNQFGSLADFMAALGIKDSGPETAGQE